MLKNKKEREEYILDNDNWEIIGEIKNLIRVEKLKNTDIYRMTRKLSNSYMNEHWSLFGEYYRLNGEGNFVCGANYTFNKNELLNYIKELA